ncbi:hypothetical protein AURDEDRAFT_128243 [Auricularia subglabra TFB-10046 SS5]|nr:hypothetical protein AURDEDRAFT_128243 [Auricularia subglabra TFB-10046 SS5]
MATRDCNLGGLMSALNRLEDVLDARAEVVSEIQQALANVRHHHQQQQNDMAPQLQALAHGLAEQGEMLQGAVGAFSELTRSFKAGVAVQNALSDARRVEMAVIAEWLSTLPDAVYVYRAASARPSIDKSPKVRRACVAPDVRHAHARAARRTDWRAAREHDYVAAARRVGYDLSGSLVVLSS